MDYKLWFWIINVISTILRVVTIGKIGLTIDEVQVYPNFLDFSYFDHLTLSSYVIKISTLVFGNNEFAIRFPAVLIFFFITWIFFICTKKLYNAKTAFFGVLLLNIIPFFSPLGFLRAVPNSQLVLFWLLSFLIFILIIETNNKNYWYLLGSAIGFATLSCNVYSGLLIYFSVFLFLILSPQHRFWLKKKELYFGLILSIIIPSPVILCNIENTWTSFGFQLDDIFRNSFLKFSLAHLIRVILSQMVYISPLLFLVFVAAVFLCIKEAYKKKDKTTLTISCFSLPILIFSNMTASLFNGTISYWPVMGYLILSNGSLEKPVSYLF
jgi:4-amino-4-deoxy-L-arabinose transferase-like glycosyltransferase